MCPLLAISRHATRAYECPLSGVKRTCAEHHAMSAFDPKRTLGSQPVIFSIAKGVVLSGDTCSGGRMGRDRFVRPQHCVDEI